MHDVTSLSRRKLLRAAAIGGGLGVVGFSRLTSQLVFAEEGDDGLDTGEDVVDDTTSALNDAGDALATADRLGEVKPPMEPPPDGKLWFPIEAGSDCYVLDNYGDCRGSSCSRLHEGVDIMGSRDMPLISVANAVLTKKYVDSGLTYGAGHGWALYDEENQRAYRYFHMSRHEDGLEEGDTVQMGDIIGYVGNTGTSGVPSDSNYHLHFEVRDVVGDSHWDSVAVDPLPLLVIPEDMCDVSPPIKA